jgi:hypothetical protein
MSTSSPSRPSTPPAPGSTRQLLDELDELMQRMLALPVNQLDEEPQPTAVAPPPAASPAPVLRPEPVVRLERPSVTVPSRPTVTEAPNPAPPRPAERAAEPVAPPAQPPAQTNPTNLTTPTTKNKEVAEQRTAPPPPKKNSPVVVSPLPAPKTSWWLRPVVWGNGVFDRWTLALGAPGRWLRSPTGRRALGWTGLALLAAAVVWGALDFFLGWTR